MKNYLYIFMFYALVLIISFVTLNHSQNFQTSSFDCNYDSIKSNFSCTYDHEKVFEREACKDIADDIINKNPVFIQHENRQFMRKFDSDFFKLYLTNTNKLKYKKSKELYDKIIKISKSIKNRKFTSLQQARTMLNGLIMLKLYKKKISRKNRMVLFRNFSVLDDVFCNAINYGILVYPFVIIDEKSGNLKWYLDLSFGCYLVNNSCVVGNEKNMYFKHLVLLNERVEKQLNQKSVFLHA